MRQAQLVVTSHLDKLSQIQHWFKHLCAGSTADLAWIHTYVDRLTLALTEGFTNAVRHAHAGLPAETTIRIDITLAPHAVEICILDHGQPFDPDGLVDPEPGSLLDSGYGWFLLRRLADQVTYKRLGDGRNCLSIIQYDA